jgi:hypothetical protein
MSTGGSRFIERAFAVQMFDLIGLKPYHVPMAPKISKRQRDILDFIEQQMRDRGFPPSVREIGDAVTSAVTPASHAQSKFDTTQTVAP